jgi:very-short-patch-repair endonuclease
MPIEVTRDRAEDLVDTDGTSLRNERLDRAVRLFEYLGRVQQVRSPAPRTLDAYKSEGSVLWFHALPAHPAVLTVHGKHGIDAGAPALTVDRVPWLAPPQPPEELIPWLGASLEDPSTPPHLSPTIIGPAASHGPDPSGGDDDRAEPSVTSLDDHPEIDARYRRWLPAWEAWAEAELAARPVRDLYGELFSMQVAAGDRPEELELVTGAACLSWEPDGQAPIYRHLLTAAAMIDFDDASGRITVRSAQSLERMNVELDMVDAALIQDPQRIHEVAADAKLVEGHPLDPEEVAALGRRLANLLDARGGYLDQDEPAPQRADALVAYAPALILRRRSQQGLVQIFQTIAAQLRESSIIPEGILPLVDPNHAPDPGSSGGDTGGAMVVVDDDVFLPLPVNEQQLRIIRRVDQAAQTLVQGPPGTGKTHTAAALIAHLVAQGKRVLVTAQTDRALKEVRDKLPRSIQPLSVAVVGAAREDMSQLKIAVEGIAQAAADHEPAVAEREIERHLTAIDELRRRRAGIHHDLVEARESEVRVYDVGGYSGTLARIAEAYQADASRYGWITPLADVEADSECPLTDAEIAEWVRLLRDPRVNADQAEAAQELIDPTQLPDPAVFADAVATEQEARTRDSAWEHLHSHAAFRTFADLDDQARSQLAARLKALLDEGGFLSSRPEPWVASALRDVEGHRASVWSARADTVGRLISAAQPLMERLGATASVEVTAADTGPLVVLAQGVLAHVRTQGRIKTDAAGRPSRGLLAPKVLKQATALFDGVLVNGVPPTTEESLDLFLTWVEATKVLDALDRAWPSGTEIPPEDTPGERLHWHVAETELLRRVVRYAEGLAVQQEQLAGMGLPAGEWSSRKAMTDLAQVLEAATARRRLDAVTASVSAWGQLSAHAARWDDAAACVEDIAAAIRTRDPMGYRAAHTRLHELLEIREFVTRRDQLGSRLEVAAHRLRQAVVDEPGAGHWEQELQGFSAAWRWSAAGAWVRSRRSVDVNALTTALNHAESAIRQHVEELTATRAWGYAASPERITGEAKANLAHYAQMVKSLGKGTGKYANHKRLEIRAAMDRCRSSVPVWILPIYRIAEQLRIKPNMFDVVIVDEASQAGTEATFLQYLAPKMVVIGDDKQVSPSAVGLEQQQLIDLAGQYLFDDPYRASWSDPQRSLFDAAKMRYGGLITLVEHRRCVPEIIGFSNRVAYEPDGIRLIPVRQYGADRLEPVVPVYLPEGYAKGQTNRVNPVEVDAIVDQIEKCLVDPRYDGLTFGVISLLGTAQAKEIERRLLARIEPEEWRARDLRCGDSADFQGSERDVVFLSMVAAPEPGKRTIALTREMYLQRYNVAASRAKDQMWIFHSVSLGDLGNPEDMRFALLDYCYGVAKRSQTGEATSGPVPDDVPVAPFDSLFEQRVFNRLLDRGYAVIPQYEVQGYRIDLVVVGSECKVAIECDGDAWHGADAYERDLARQRELERCGWRFFRIPEFRFYVDPAGALAPLWDLLDDLDVHPSGWTRSESAASVIPAPAPFAPIPENRSTVAAILDETTLMDDEAEGDDGVEAPLPDEAGGARSSSEMDTLRAVPSGDGQTNLVAQTPHDADDRADEPAWDDTWGLAPYVAFSGRTASATAASRARVLEDIVAIVAVEGPVVGERLQQVHVQASGGQRVGRLFAQAINQAISHGVRTGRLIEDNPLGEQGIKPRTYRLPHQALVSQRTRGPRQLEHIPPSELAATMREVGGSSGWRSEEALFRETLERYGSVRLGPNVVDRLRKVKRLVQS